MHDHTNELINESSPYLLQHAHNPVDWHAWSKENLSEAKKLGKPLLISIGYSSCHWCHVMEHESFENEVIAEYMNEHFYCIKVDREERPDVDQIYMTAANIITGSGGWPLNCFALPDGRPFHAGTYYPATGWQKLLESVNSQFENNHERIVEYATKLTRGIELQETAISDNVAKKLDPKFLATGLQYWKQNWDMKEGGMSKAPKFPMPCNLDYLIEYTYSSLDTQTEEFTNLTLTKMAEGGIFDQIGGGFSRYSVDAIWKAPHFEKMLYDNAQLLSVYSKAYKRTKNTLYLEIIEKTINWLEREMLDSSGLFYAALDADSEGEEGKFYVWKSREIKEIFKEDYPFVADLYSIEQKGLWEHGNNILLREKSDAELIKTYELSNEDLKVRKAEIDLTLLKHRSKRIRPGIDDKCLTSWNALTVIGLLEAYKATHKQQYRTLAIHCLNALSDLQIDSNLEIHHTYKNGKSTIQGMLDDYAFTGEACIAAYEVTGDEKYATLASKIVSTAIKKFYDADKEIFFFNEQNELILRTTEVYDNVIPSTNSSMAHLMHSVGLIYGNPNLLELSSNIIGKMQDNIEQYPGSHSNWARALHKQTSPYYEIAVVGDESFDVSKELQSLDIPNALIVPCNKNSEIPLMKDRLVNGQTRIYVCQKGTCQLPVESIEQALKLIER